MRTFAAPFEKRVADEALSSSQDWRMRIRLERFFLKNFHKSLADSKNMRTFAAPLEKRVLAREYGKFIEKTVLLYKKQVPRKNTIYREALISLWNYKCQDKLRDL